MNLEVYLPLTLSQAQTALAFILSILGIGWFFFLSVVIRYNASRKIMKEPVPVLETVLPLNVLDIFNLLRIRRTEATIITCLLVILGLTLTNFDSIIVVNTIGFDESCKTAVVKTRAQITTETFQVAVAAYAETDAMLRKREKSGVPSGVLVGQLPEDPRWRFDADLDVEPYPWRSSCSIYASGTTNVNMNTSIMYDAVYQQSDLREMLPEVNTEYKFNNSPDGYNYTRRSFKSYKHFIKGIGGVTEMATGSLTLIIEEFTRKNTSEIGAGVIHRLWTLRVPKENQITYHRTNASIVEIVSVPIFVKAYTCEVIRVKEGRSGSVNLLGDIAVAMDTAGDLIGRKFLTAQIKGTDDTILEYTPEYWASYMEVRDTMTANTSEVPAQINLPCISIHPIFLLLVVVYIIFIFTGIIFWILLCKNESKIPATGVVNWAIHACKESNLPKATEAVFKSDDTKDIRISYKENNPIDDEQSERDSKFIV